MTKALPAGQDPKDEAIALLEQKLLDKDAENVDLRRQLREVKATADARAQAQARAVGALKAMLAEPFRALQVLFGELDKFEPTEVGRGDSGNSGGISPIWNDWKARLTPKQWDFVVALMGLRNATRSQLKAATKSGNSTTDYAIRTLVGMGLFVRDGQEYKLKDL